MSHLSLIVMVREERKGHKNVLAFILLRVLSPRRVTVCYVNYDKEADAKKRGNEENIKKCLFFMAEKKEKKKMRSSLRC